jgi:P27 family predicted phage terminase small subunit
MTMALRGRKPTPVVEKILTGNPGGRSLATMLPQPRKRKPTPHKVVEEDPRAMRHWTLVLEECAPGHLVRLDTALLERFCKCMSRLEEAEEKLEGTSMMLRSPQGFPIQSPWLSVVNKQTELSRKLASELGITPAMRNRMGANDGADADDDPTSHFFN